MSRPQLSLSPLTRTTCESRFDEWRRGITDDDGAAESMYIGGIESASRWVKEEINERAFDELDEAEQRRVTSWAFLVRTEESKEDKDDDGDEAQQASEATECAICCVELVTQRGRVFDEDGEEQKSSSTPSLNEFWWPTIRMVHMVLSPTADLEQAAGSVFSAAEAMLNFCDENRLRLDYLALRLSHYSRSSRTASSEDPATTAGEGVDGPSRAETETTGALEWLNGNEVDWQAVFDACSPNTYDSDDFIPGAT